MTLRHLTQAATEARERGDSEYYDEWYGNEAEHDLADYLRNHAHLYADLEAAARAYFDTSPLPTPLNDENALARDDLRAALDALTESEEAS